MRMNSAKQYKCPACGAPIGFDAATGDVTCQSCGNAFDISTLETLEHDTQSFQWGDHLHQEDTATMEGTRTYQCVSCGAQIEVDATTAATRCPYCDNNVVLTDQVSGGLRPNAVIPFRITRKELPAVVNKFYRGKHLLPKTFLSQRKLKEVQGIYVPFWLFDCRMDGNMVMQGTRIRHYREGDYDCTETSYYLLEREGEMSFSRVPVDASVKMPDDLMDSLEPFDYADLVDFNDAYLSGYLADRFDSSPDAELPRADRRMLNSAVDVLRRTAIGYSSVTIRANGMHITDADVRYVLLPVYLLNYEYQGKTYRLAVNGQTGKVVGQLPISKGRSLAWFLGSGTIGAAVAFLLGMLLQ
jgi:DNA-directed RNA polymerase subunit RPC12/RpoP